jgi:hypothetical protein
MENHAVTASSIKIEFGYYPLELPLDVGSIEIRTLPDLDQKITALSGSDCIYNDWIYAPPEQVHDFSGSIHTRPYAARVFGLPKTHTFQHSNADSKDHLTFQIWALSFFLGIRLTAMEAGFLDATPMLRGKLVDFLLSGRGGLGKAVEIADAFWVENRRKPECARGFAAAVHALFIGQNPRHLQFEKFIFFYTALDACYTLAALFHAPPKRLGHAKKIGWMCDLFKIKTPSWAAEVAVLRNATLHEALFMDHPLGFALHGVGTNQNLMLEMQALICRLLVALLGAAASDYVRTPINTRQRHGLDLR